MPNWQLEGRKAQKPPHVIQHVTFRTTNKEKVQRAAADSWAAKCDYNAVCLSLRSPKKTCDEKGAAPAQPHKTWTGAFGGALSHIHSLCFQLWFIFIVAHILHFTQPQLQATEQLLLPVLSGLLHRLHHRVWRKENTSITPETGAVLSFSPRWQTDADARHI